MQSSHPAARRSARRSAAARRTPSPSSPGARPAARRSPTLARTLSDRVRWRWARRSTSSLLKRLMASRSALHLKTPANSRSTLLPFSTAARSQALPSARRLAAAAPKSTLALPLAQRSATVVLSKSVLWPDPRAILVRRAARSSTVAAPRLSPPAPWTSARPSMAPRLCPLVARPVRRSLAAAAWKSSAPELLTNSRRSAAANRKFMASRPQIRWTRERRLLNRAARRALRGSTTAALRSSAPAGSMSLPRSTAASRTSTARRAA